MAPSLNVSINDVNRVSPSVSGNGFKSRAGSNDVLSPTNTFSPVSPEGDNFDDDINDLGNNLASSGIQTNISTNKIL